MKSEAYFELLYPLYLVDSLRTSFKAVTPCFDCLTKTNPVVKVSSKTFKNWSIKIFRVMLFREEALRNFGYNISFIVQYIPKYKSQAIGSSSLCRICYQALAVITSSLWPKLGFGLIYIYLVAKLYEAGLNAASGPVAFLWVY